MKHIGIIGAGQLGQMLALAGTPLGYTFTFIDPSHQPCAAGLGHHIQAEYDDEAALEQLGIECDLVTFEFENVPAPAIEHLKNFTTVHPTVQALETAQDRLNEKTFFRNHGIPVGEFAAVSSWEQLQAAVANLGLPAVLKTRRFGYDGKGQRVLKTPDDIQIAWKELGGTPLILEAFIPFTREVSIIAVRSIHGEMAFYPLTENVHRDGILHRSIARPGDWMQAQAESHARKVMEALNYAGVMGFEFFQVEDRLLANEIAPRVHNSGHWTQNGAVTSQFENHLRAIDGLPLGNTNTLCHAGMLNFIGKLPDREQVLRIPGTHWHDYHKEPRSGRKVGHVNITAPTAPLLEERLAHVEALMDPA